MIGLGFSQIVDGTRPTMVIVESRNCIYNIRAPGLHYRAAAEECKARAMMAGVKVYRRVLTAKEAASAFGAGRSR